MVGRLKKPTRKQQSSSLLGEGEISHPPERQGPKERGACGCSSRGFLFFFYPLAPSVMVAGPALPFEKKKVRFIFTWDPTTDPIISTWKGTIRFRGLVEGRSGGEELDGRGGGV